MMIGLPAKSRSIACFSVALTALVFCFNMLAQDRARTATSVPAFPATNTPLKQVGSGLFELGKVRLDKRQRAITFPAVLNMNKGTLEYLLVTTYGKTHESLLRTEAEPSHIHLVMLLLGAKGAGTNSFPPESDQPLPGDKVTIELSWSADGKQRRRRAEELILNRQTSSVMSKGDWVYNGSRVIEGAFTAQQDGSVVSLITDPDALVNNPRPGRENDENWAANQAKLPALNSPIQVMIKLGRITKP